MNEEAKSQVVCLTDVCPEFRKQIADIVGENVLCCYQCGECTAGCPAAFAMDISPNQVMRMAQLGMKEDVLSSSAIWLCAGCETCATRCPRGVGLSKVMDACRQIAIREGRKPKEQGVAKFHDQFLKEIQRFGRVHEITLMGLYKARTRSFFADVIQGVQMFLKGKLGLLPSWIRGRSEVRRLIESRKRETAKDSKA